MVETNTNPEGREHESSLNTLIIFGPPGVGKNFVGEILETHFGYHFYDGDIDIPPEMKVYMEQGIPTPEEIVDNWMQNVIDQTIIKGQDYDKVAVGIATVFKKYIDLFKSSLPNATFISLETQRDIVEQRLSARKGHSLDPQLGLQLYDMFEYPDFDYIRILNNAGNEEIIDQFSVLFE